MHEIKSKRPRWQTFDLFNFSSFIFKKLVLSLKQTTFPEKNVVVEEGLDGIDIDDIGNLEGSPRLKLINEECEDLIVVNDGGERTRNINQKKKSEV